MLSQYKKRGNIGVTVGFLLQFLAAVANLNSALGLEFIFLVPGVILFLWGCINYSKSKGYSWAWGLLGLGQIIGQMVLISLPDRSDSLADVIASTDKEKKKMNPLYIVLSVVIFVGFVYFLIPSGLPPHEFACGAPLSSLQELPHAVSQFLSLPALDPVRIRVETSISNAPGGSDDIATLAEYLNGKVGSRPGGAELVSELRQINTIPNPLQKVDRLLRTLIQFKDLIRDNPNQDQVIVFIHYFLKPPTVLDTDTRTAILSMVQKLDTKKQMRLFSGRRCPNNFLEGNINIYPLSMENTAWYKDAGISGDPTRPILEIRFMGLKGIFQYLVVGMSHLSGLSFVYLDGDRLSLQ